MGYQFKNQYGVVTVQDEQTINEPKEIRFITPQYRELFKIPDGGQILLCYKDGTVKARTCRYLDDYHLLVGRNAYHICEFAEMMERNGVTVMPFPEKHIVWSNLERDKTEVNEEEVQELLAKFDVEIGDDILIIGKSGFFDETERGIIVVSDGTLADCFAPSVDCDHAEWYVDRNKEFRCNEIHYNGTHQIVYRIWKSDVSFDERNDFLEKYDKEGMTQEEMDAKTEKLGGLVAVLQEWRFPTQENRAPERDAR